MTFVETVALIESIGIIAIVGSAVFIVTGAFLRYLRSASKFNKKETERVATEVVEYLNRTIDEAAQQLLADRLAHRQTLPVAYSRDRDIEEAF